MIEIAGRGQVVDAAMVDGTAALRTTTLARPADTEAVLRDAGFSAEEITQLHAAGAIA